MHYRNYFPLFHNATYYKPGLGTPETCLLSSGPQIMGLSLNKKFFSVSSNPTDLPKSILQNTFLVFLFLPVLYNIIFPL